MDSNTLEMTRTRKHKLEEDLKTLYYYRRGILKIEFVDNSRLGLYANEYVFIRKYCKERDQFLIEDCDGDKSWTDMIIPIKPSIEGHELYYTSFPLLVKQNYRDGDEVSFRTRNGFASLKKEIRVCCLEYEMFLDGRLNLDNVPKGYNFALGYPDNLAQVFNSEMRYE
jgi:hypothetical protein